MHNFALYEFWSHAHNRFSVEFVENPGALLNATYNTTVNKQQHKQHQKQYTCW